MSNTGGLVLTLEEDQLIKIGDDVTIQFYFEPKRGHWRVRIIAPKHVKIDRVDALTGERKQK